MLVRRWVLVGLVAAAGCDDHLYGEPLGEDTGTASSAYSCDWTGVQELFHDQCDACHTADDEGNVGSGGFVLVDAIEAELADTATAEPYYVVPGDPDASMLWQSITGQSGQLMPFGYTEPLDMSQIEHVECWINDGAPL